MVENAGGEGIPWIDPHVHILPPRRLRGLVRWVKSFTPDFPVPEDITAEEILESIRASGIPRFFNLVFPLWPEETGDLNRFNRDFCAGVPEAVPFGSLHIDNPDKEAEALRCLEEYGFAGMKLHPFAQRFPAFDPAMDPLFRVLDRLGRPLLVHTGFDAFYGDDLHREDLLRVLKAFPGMPVVMVHSFFPDFGFARSLLDRFPQVWLDMTNSVSCMRLYLESTLSGRPLPDMASSLDANEVEANLGNWAALFAGHSHRIIYGTDYPAGFGDHPSLLSDLLYFDFPPETIRLVLHDNAARLLASCGGGSFPPIPPPR